MSCRKATGFTLVELMITIAVLAVLMAIAFPNFQGTIRSNRVATSTNEMISALALARSEAIKSTRGGGVCPSSSGTGCDGTWQQGWIVWSDANGDGQFEAGEPILRYAQAKPNMVITAADGSPIAFNSRGLRLPDSGQSVTLRPEECGTQQLQRKIDVTATGQTKVVKEDCAS
ncbi:MAG TPA: pre-pilin like leader sequence [Xanthomonadaceae bacterium]|nr:pre-pilin like leader sequence [Xanthomonadaceae bacterium]